MESDGKPRALPWAWLPAAALVIGACAPPRPAYVVRPLDVPAPPLPATCGNEDACAGPRTWAVFYSQYCASCHEMLRDFSAASDRLGREGVCVKTYLVDVSGCPEAGLVAHRTGSLPVAPVTEESADMQRWCRSGRCPASSASKRTRRWPILLPRAFAPTLTRPWKRWPGAVASRRGNCTVSCGRATKADSEVETQPTGEVSRARRKGANRRGKSGNPRSMARKRSMQSTPTIPVGAGGCIAAGRTGSARRAQGRGRRGSGLAGGAARFSEVLRQGPGQALDREPLP